MNSHLNTEQLEAVLAGRSSHEASQHLNGCARCTEDVASMRDVLGNFRSAAMRAAEHHRHFAKPVAATRVPRMAWVVASVALFMGVVTPMAVHRYRPGQVAGGGVAVKAPETISDEALLNNVQDDLSASVPESLLPLAGNATNAVNSTNEKRKN